MSNWLIIVLAALAVLIIAGIGFELWQPKRAARLAHDVAAALAQAVAADPALHDHVDVLVAVAYAVIPMPYRMWVSLPTLQALAWDAIRAVEPAPPVIPPVIPPAA